jgi:hypothetical protein
MWSGKRSYMEPISLIVTSLALGAAAGLKPTVEQAIKDAYGGLKSLLQRKYAKVSVEQLEEAPESKARRAVIEEDLTKTGADKDEEVLRQAKILLDVIQAHAPETASAIGIDLNVVASGEGAVAIGRDAKGNTIITGNRQPGALDPKGQAGP